MAAAATHRAVIASRPAMPTRHALHAEAHRLRRLGDASASLRLFIALLRAAPHDLDARLGLGDTLLAGGFTREAAEAWSALLVEASASGHPLVAVATLKRLARLDGAANALFADLATRYGSDTRAPGPGARISPPAGEAEVPPEAFGQSSWRDTDLATAILGMLRTREGLPPLPPTVPAIPLLSTLPAGSLARFVATAILHDLPEGTTVLREGEAATSFFLVARGRVEVVRGDLVVSTLGPGSVFGEMALLSQAPRSATVRVRDDADLLEFGADSLRTVAAEIPVIAAGLDRFMQQRFVAHTLATHPLFASFGPAQRPALAARVTVQAFAPGEALVVEGSEDAGLFVMLTGEVEVSCLREGARVHLATLGPGEVLGEISVIDRVPATATVRARGSVRALVVPRAVAERLVAGVESMRAWLGEVAEARALDTQLALSAADEPPLV